jgi:hypothetical protein
MTATVSAETTAKRIANLRPHRYPKGTSGITVKSKRYLEIRANVVASLGAEPCGIDAVAVDQIVQLLLRAERTKDHDDAARCSRTAHQWLKDVQARRVKRSEPPLRERIAAEFAGD